MTLQDILIGSKRFKACCLTNSISDANQAITTFLSPQGREFALNTGYPRLEDIRNTSDIWMNDRRIHLDSGNVTVGDYDSIAAGDTSLTLIADKPSKLYHVMAIHGARVTVKASEYAVVTATNVCGTIEVVNDGTAVINIEKRYE